MNEKKPLNDSLKLNINLSVKELNVIWQALEDENNLLIMNRFITHSTKRNRIKIYRQVQKKITSSLKKAGVPDEI